MKKSNIGGKERQKEASSKEMEISKNSKYTQTEEMKTLEDALHYFYFSSFLPELDKSLEDVRRHRKGKEVHDLKFKRLDKEIKKLSFYVHPDLVKKRCTPNREITHDHTFQAVLRIEEHDGQYLQSVINITRLILNSLHEAFLEDLETGHKYEFYTNIKLYSMGNEDKIRKLVQEVAMKITHLSEIKHQNIIPEIRTFLQESRSCVKSYIDHNVNDFEKYCSSTMFYLNNCVEGYKKSSIEFKAVQEKCADRDLECGCCLVHSRILNKCSRELSVLEKLIIEAKRSLDGTYEIFDCSQEFDEYFILPLVCYVNIILMCNIMKYTWGKKWFANGNFFGFLSSIFFPPDRKFIIFNKETCFLMTMYYLSSYCSGNKLHSFVIKDMFGKLPLTNEEIEKAFLRNLKQTNRYLEENFKIDDYEVRLNNKFAEGELNICEKKMDEFEMKVNAMAENNVKFKDSSQEMEKIMENSEEFRNKVAEQLKQTKILRERISTLLD